MFLFHWHSLCFDIKMIFFYIADLVMVTSSLLPVNINHLTNSNSSHFDQVFQVLKELQRQNFIILLHLLDWLQFPQNHFFDYFTWKPNLPFSGQYFSSTKVWNLEQGLVRVKKVRKVRSGQKVFFRRRIEWTPP